MSFKIRNTFSKGAVDTNTSHEYIPSDTLVGLENMDVYSLGNGMSLVPSKGNFKKFNEVAGKAKTFLGSAEWNDKAYLFYARYESPSKGEIYEYNKTTSALVSVLSLDYDVVGFPEYDDPDLNSYVLSADVVGGVFLHWTWAVRGSDGELTGFGEPKRIHIADAKANPTGYSNISGNYARPGKPLVSSGFDNSIGVNNLEFGSYVFYKRYITKYDEYTVLSYPSDNIDVSEGFNDDVLPNYIQISPFTVGDDIHSVEILVSNDSSNTFRIVNTIDTRTNKTVPLYKFYNSNEYPVLGGMSSDIVNNDFPITATEQTVADNRIVYGGATIERKFEDSNGDPISKDVPFFYTATGVSRTKTNVFPQTNDTAGSITIAYAWVLNTTYQFTIMANFSGGHGGKEYYQFDWTYTSSSSVAELNLLVKEQNSTLGVTGASLASITISDFTAGDLASGWAKVDAIPNNYAAGLNSDFTYNGYIVFLDDAGRNCGATNRTKVFYDGDEWTFNVKPNLSASGITAPSWATKYMFVRDKVNTNLCYGIVGSSTASASGLRSGYHYLRVETPFYTNYFADKRGEAIRIFSKDLNTHIEAFVLNLEERADETITDESGEYLYVDANYVPADGSVVLYAPNKSVEAKSEVLYETSDVYDITGGVFMGDIVASLKWYDTKIGEYNKGFATSTGDKDIPIMKTDTVSLSDINHLGRGAYTYLYQTDIESNTTIMHSQKFTPESNYNGLSEFSTVYGNVKTLERSWGAVEKLFYDNTNLLIGQKRKWSRCLLDKSVITTASGDGTLATSTKFFNDIVPDNGEYGITDKRSFASWGYRRYFVDQDRGIFCRMSADGITDIGTTRSDEIGDALRDYSRGNPIIGGYDAMKDEYLVCLYTDGTIYRFSEESKAQIGNYVLSSIPYKYILLGQNLYTITQSDDDVMWEENIGLGGGSFYGSDVTRKFSFIVNQEPDIVKDYISMSINGWIPATSDLPSGTCDMDVTIETFLNSTTLTLSDFLRRENILYADFMKDENADGGAVFGVGTTLSTSGGDTVLLKSAANNLRVGDSVYWGSDLIGVVQSFSGASITFTTAFVNTPIPDDFLHTKRTSKVEGRSIKGNTAKVTIEIADDYNRFFADEIKVFAVTTNINPSSHTE